MENAKSNLPAPAKPPRTLLDWLVSIPFLLVFFGILVFFDILQRIAFLCGRRQHEIVIVWANGAIYRALGLLGTDIILDKQLTLKPDTPYIIVSNHQSLFDVSILHTVFARHFPRFIAKKELAYWIPLVSFNLRRGQNAIIDRSDSTQAVEEIDRLGKLMCDRGFASVIFPEGTRSRDGVLRKFRFAGLASLMKTAPTAAIVPVALDGSWKLSAFKLWPVPRNVRVRITVGAPIERTDSESFRAVAKKAHTEIRALLEKMRDENEGATKSVEINYRTG